MARKYLFTLHAVILRHSQLQGAIELNTAAGAEQNSHFVAGIARDEDNQISSFRAYTSCCRGQEGILLPHTALHSGLDAQLCGEVHLPLKHQMLVTLAPSTLQVRGMVHLLVCTYSH